MAAQSLLLPSLYSLLPSSSFLTFTSHLSLQSIHIEPYTIVESVYLPNTTVIPNQIRPLRLQATLKNGDRKGKFKATTIEDDDEWEYKLAYISQPLSGREYSDMSVRAFLTVTVSNGNRRGNEEERKGIEEWIKLLGYTISHTHTRTGLLFHLPLPEASTTLQLSITRLLPPGSIPPTDSKIEDSAEPYFVELRPAKPQQPVPIPDKREVGIQEMMRLMRNVTSRIDGLEWQSGRP